MLFNMGKVNLKILMVSNNFSTGENYGGVCKDLAKLFAANGSRVTITSKWKNRYLRPLNMLQVACTKRDQYDIAQIDLFSGAAFFWAELVANFLLKLKKPFILSLHGGNLPNFSRKYPHRVKKLLAKANAVTTPSSYLQHAMKQYCSNTILIPNPIDLSQFKFVPRKQADPKLIWLRAFAEIYNPLLVADVINILKDSHPNVTVNMIGPDKGDNSLQKFQEKLQTYQLYDHINICGPIARKDVPHYLQQGDIFLNTSNVDNTPVSIIEAMACGLCVVSTNVGGLPYLLEHEKDTLLVPPNNPSAIVQVIKRVLTEPYLAQKLSQNARNKVEQFDASVVLHQWEKLLISTLESK